MSIISAIKDYIYNKDGDKIILPKTTIDQVLTSDGSAPANLVEAVNEEPTGIQLEEPIYKSDVINNLVSTDNESPLSANMGRELKEEIENKFKLINTINTIINEPNFKLYEKNGIVNFMIEGCPNDVLSKIIIPVEYRPIYPIYTYGYMYKTDRTRFLDCVTIININGVIQTFFRDSVVGAWTQHYSSDYCTRCYGAYIVGN